MIFHAHIVIFTCFNCILWVFSKGISDANAGHPSPWRGMVSQVSTLVYFYSFVFDSFISVSLHDLFMRQDPLPSVDMQYVRVPKERFGPLKGPIDTEVSSRVFFSRLIKIHDEPVKSWRFKKKIDELTSKGRELEQWRGHLFGPDPLDIADWWLCSWCIWVLFLNFKNLTRLGLVDHQTLHIQGVRPRPVCWLVEFR